MKIKTVLEQAFQQDSSQQLNEFFDIDSGIEMLGQALDAFHEIQAKMANPMTTAEFNELTATMNSWQRDQLAHLAIWRPEQYNFIDAVTMMRIGNEVPTIAFVEDLRIETINKMVDAAKYTFPVALLMYIVLGGEKKSKATVTKAEAIDKMIRERDVKMKRLNVLSKGIYKWDKSSVKEAKKLTKEIDRLSKTIKRDAGRIYKDYEKRRGDLKAAMKPNEFKRFDDMMADYKEGKLSYLGRKDLNV